MAQTDDRSTTSMPGALLALAVALLVARAATSLLATLPASSVDQPVVVWNDPASFKSLPASDTKKLTIYQFYAEWSDPCKSMEATALSNKQVCQLLNNDYIPIRVVDRQREEGKNPQWIANLEKRYRVFALPTLVVVKEDGEPVGSLIGNCSSLTTYRFLTRTLHQSEKKVASSDNPVISTTSFKASLRAIRQFILPPKTHV